MAKKSTRNTRGRIVSAAWKLFYEQGYEDTTVEEIIELSGTSKGSFYHYFDGKDALLSTLSSLFDEKYEELTGLLTPEMTAMEQLLFLNRELFHMIEDSISLDLLARLYSTQLTTNGEKHLLDHNRIYYKLLRKIIAKGQAEGQLSSRSNVNEMVKLYDSEREKPVLLESGQYIKFRPVTEEEYKAIEKQVENNTYQYVVYDKEAE